MVSSVLPDPLVGQTQHRSRLSTPLEADHPLSPHSISLYTSKSRRSPSVFAIPLLDDGASGSGSGAGYFEHEPASSRPPPTAGVPDPDQVELLGDGSSRAPKKNGPRGSKNRASLTLDTLGPAEVDVVKRRWDLMADEEIRRLLEEWEVEGTDRSQTNGEALNAEASSSAIPTLSPTTLPRSSSSTQAVLSRQSERSSETYDPTSPLFPPSPPSGQVLAGVGESRALRTDHPLRILARAVIELQDTVERLRAENEALRADISGERRRSGAGLISIHDDLNEAISTSLTTAPIFIQNPGRMPNPPRVPSPAPSTSSRRPQSVRSHHRDTTSRSIDARSDKPPSSTAVLPSNRSVRSIDTDEVSLSGKSPAPVRKRDASRASWTSSLWGWGEKTGTAKKGEKGRKGSISSLREQLKGGNPPVFAEEEDEHAWRSGDGGSSPAFKAIFQATRLVTPDPLSILSSHIAPNSLVAILAHTLVSNARDQGAVARDAPTTRRRPSKENRSRAASVLSQESQTTAEHGRERTYGETLAATALYGRSFLSGVSGATLSGGRKGTTRGDETIRPPSLLSRTSARTFPTTALSPSAAGAGGPALDDDEAPLPSVEMGSIVAGELQPPTVLLSRQNLGLFFQAGKGKGKVETASRFRGMDTPLTDRYGFIYDIQHASMLKDASVAGVPPPASLSGVIPGREEGEGWIERQRRASHESRPDLSRQSTDSVPSATPATVSTGSSGTSTPHRDRPPSTSRQPPSELRHRSSTLINLNPSPARPVTAKDTLTISARGASSLRSVASPLLDTVSDPTPPAVSRATISSLLDQLTELHDRQQAERKVEWDAWLNKRNGKRGSAVRNKESGWGGDLIGISQMGLGDAEEWRVFAKLVRHGIPLAYRSDVWAECSGAKDAMVPGEYREILAVHAQDISPVLAEIEKDVGRTFPGNLFYGGDGPGVDKLRRVLVAYSWRNPRVGYCQGMNMLAATLLLTHTDEEQAFWVLSMMIDRLLPTDFYSPSLLASRADQAVLSELVEVHLPRISATLLDLGVDLASITFGWFLSLFTDCLPVETLFRVWDVFFVEGHNTLFRVALAILKLNEAEICASESAGDLFAHMAGMTGRLWAADKLVQTQHAYRPTVRHADIAARYAKHLSILQEP